MGNNKSRVFIDIADLKTIIELKGRLHSHAHKTIVAEVRKESIYAINRTNVLVKMSTCLEFKNKQKAVI